MTIGMLLFPRKFCNPKYFYFAKPNLFMDAMEKPSTPICDIIRERIEELTNYSENSTNSETAIKYRFKKYELQDLLEKIQPIEENSAENILARLPLWQSVSVTRFGWYPDAESPVEQKQHFCVKFDAEDIEIFSQSPTEALLELEKKITSNK